MTDTKKTVPDRPCKGNYADCSNPSGPGRWFTRQCNPQKCKYYRAPQVPVSIIFPARNETDTENTALSYLQAGAAEVIVIDDASDTPVTIDLESVTVHRNTSAKGPAWCRNHGAEIATQPAVCWSDAHVRFDGNLTEFVQAAHDLDAVLCATCRTMDTNRVSGWGGKWSPNGFHPYPRVIWNQTRPAERFEQINALCGSVYCCTRETLDKFGGWPSTISHGYNEAAISLACLFAGVPMIVDRDTSIRHEFRTRHPYRVRSLDQVINRVLVNRALWDDAEPLESQAAKKRSYTQARRWLDTRPETVRAVRNRFRPHKVRSDTEVRSIIGMEKPPAPVIAGIMALAPDLFAPWRSSLFDLAERVDVLVLWVDAANLGEFNLQAVLEAYGSKIAKIIVSTELWNRWNWREDMLRALDRIEPDFVLCPDQDEIFDPDHFDADFAAFRSSGKDGMMFHFDNPTEDDRSVPEFPTGAHMKAFRWRPGLSYGPEYAGFARVRQYVRSSHQYQASTRIRHFCFYTPDLEAAKVCH